MTEQAMLEQDWITDEYDARMRKVFNLILEHNLPKYREHWKHPIYSKIPRDIFDAADITFFTLRDAVDYFTATLADVSFVGDTVLVIAAGYWAGHAN